jgi:hypothetical protein
MGLTMAKCAGCGEPWPCSDSKRTDIRGEERAKHHVAPDFFVRDEGSIFLLEPLTDDAREWAKEHLPADATYWGDSVVVEHRYIRDIVVGIRRDGLVVR